MILVHGAFPPEARILVVTESRIAPAAEVHEKFRRVKPLKEISVTQRGESKTPKALARDGYRSSGLDVLNAIRRLVESRRRGDESLTEKSEGDQRLLTSSPTFTTTDVYAFTRELEQLHPDNKHIKDKIRQQLQVLRNAGLLLHLGRGLASAVKPWVGLLLPILQD